MPEITFLGTGTSNGIPVIGCDCHVCRSTDPRDRRSRTSALVRFGEHSVLIDTATELRSQALANDIRRIDAVLFTHAHADHVGGLDDLRRFNELQQQRIPIYADPHTAEVLRERFAYTLNEVFPFFGGKPDLDLFDVEGPFELFGQEIVPIPVLHGRLPILGYRIGDLAYITDAKEIPDSSRELLRGLDVLVLNGLRPRPHPTHLGFGEAVEIIEDLRPRHAFLIHLSHECSHEEATAMLPTGIEVAWDGLTIATRQSQEPAAVGDGAVPHPPGT